MGNNVEVRPNPRSSLSVGRKISSILFSPAKRTFGSESTPEGESSRRSPSCPIKETLPAISIKSRTVIRSSVPVRIPVIVGLRENNIFPTVRPEGALAPLSIT